MKRAESRIQRPVFSIQRAETGGGRRGEGGDWGSGGVADGEGFGGGGEAFVLGPEEGVGGGDDGGEDEDVVPLEAFSPEDVLLQEIVGLLVVGWLEVGEGAEVLDSAEAVGETTDGEFADDEGVNGEEIVFQERVEAGLTVAEVVAPDVGVGEDVHGD